MESKQKDREGNGGVAPPPLPESKHPYELWHRKYRNTGIRVDAIEGWAMCKDFFEKRQGEVITASFEKWKRVEETLGMSFLLPKEEQDVLDALSQ